MEKEPIFRAEFPASEEIVNTAKELIPETNLDFTWANVLGVVCLTKKDIDGFSDIVGVKPSLVTQLSDLTAVI